MFSVTLTWLFFETLSLRPGVVKSLEEFKLSVYGENYDEETDHGKASEASKKRKATAELAAKEAAAYDWGELADNGKVWHLPCCFCFNTSA